MSGPQILGAIAGAIVGFVTESPQAGFATYAAVSGVATYLDQPDREGPRLEDLRSQLSSYGNNIPYSYGCNRFAGTVIWPRIIEAVEHEHSQSTKGGPDQVTFTYTLSFAVLIQAGEIAGVRRIWANKKLIYDVSTGNEGATRDPAISGLRFYLGTDDQEPDSLIQAVEGSSPAYRGYAYVVFEDYDVTEMNGRVPQFEFEVITHGSEPDTEATSIGDAGNAAAIDPNTGYVWSVSGSPNSHIDVYVNDIVSETVVQHLTIVPSSTAGSMGNDITYVPLLNEYWVADENGTDVIAINASTYSYRQINFGFSWSGLIHYCPGSGNVVIGITNTNSALAVIDVTIPDHVKTLSISSSVFGIDEVVSLDAGFEAVLCDDKITYCHIFGTASAIVSTYTDSRISGNAVMIKDEGRGRLIVLNQSSDSLLVFDMDTATFTEHTLDFPVGTPGSPSESLRRILYHEQNDKYYVTAHNSGEGWTLYTVNPDDYSVEFARVYSGPTNVGTMIEVPGKTSYFIYVDSGTDEAWKIPVQGSIDPNDILLSDVVADLCEKPGLTSAQYDVSQLTDTFPGYLVGRQMQARAAIEPLQTAFFFDVVESDRKIKFVKRGSATITTIPLEDRAAHTLDQDMPSHLQILRAFEYELPYQCDIEYSDIDADHQVGNQYDRRITKDTRQRLNIQLPITLHAEKAKQIAGVALYDVWKKLTFKFATTVKYAYLEPTDLVYLPTESATYTAMITNRIEHPSGVIEWEARIEDTEIYSQSGAGAVTPGYTPQTVFEPTATILALMDIPLLRDEDDNAGYYSAMGASV